MATTKAPAKKPAAKKATPPKPPAKKTRKPAGISAPVNIPEDDDGRGGADVIR